MKKLVPKKTDLEKRYNNFYMPYITGEYGLTESVIKMFKIDLLKARIDRIEKGIDVDCEV